jgi:ComF family protein
MIYPRYCLGCGQDAPEAFKYLCYDCWSDQKKVQLPYCTCCGDPILGAVDHDFSCYRCSSVHPNYDKARSAMRYSGVVVELIKRFKYQHAFYLADDLIAWLHALVEATCCHEPFSCILPVPLHPQRQRERGYNQSTILARGLAQRMQVRWHTPWLFRVRPTIAQTHLTQPQRISNVAGAFEADVSCAKKYPSVLLVDDVMTTGATVEACSKALCQAGVERVCVATIARG